MKFFKRVFWLGVLSFVAFWGWKFYERVRAVFKLDNSLPLFLKNTVGEKPGIHINMAFSNLSITLRFEQETLDKEENLEQMVREYIEDFYPVLAGLSIAIHITPREEAKVVEPEPVEADAAPMPEQVEEPATDGDE